MAKDPRSHRKLRIAIFFLFFFVLFFKLLFMFPCKHCPGQFNALSSRGLTQHQRKCQAFLRHEAEANQWRKTTASSNKIRQAKLKDRKVHTGFAPPEVSLFFDKYHG